VTVPQTVANGLDVACMSGSQVFFVGDVFAPNAGSSVVVVPHAAGQPRCQACSGRKGGCGHARAVREVLGEAPLAPAAQPHRCAL
jgi:hypothetical protein